MGSEEKMIRFHIHTTYAQLIYTALCTVCLLFTLSACTSSEAELAQKVQTLSKEEKIAAFRAEIQTAINENSEDYDYSLDRYLWPDDCFKGNDALFNVSSVLITSPYTADLPSDELLTIFKRATNLPVSHIIQPQTDPDHIIIGFLCGIGPSSDRLTLTGFYLLDRSGHAQRFGVGNLVDSWTFPDGAVLLVDTKVANNTHYIKPHSLYRIYNDGTGWQVSELIFNPEPYHPFDTANDISFDENGERFTVHIHSYGTPCEYTSEFMEKYKFVLDWDVTLSYAFDDGLFILEEREYGDWTASGKRETLKRSEWQQFCVSGTLRPLQSLSKGEQVAALRAEIQKSIAIINESFENGTYTPAPTPDPERFSETKSYSKPASRDNSIKNYDDFLTSYASRNYCFGKSVSFTSDDATVYENVIADVSMLLMTSLYATDLSPDELLTVFKTETRLPIEYIIRPQTELDHIIIGFRFCSPYSRYTDSISFYLLDRSGYLQQFASGGLIDFWTFPDGEGLFISTSNLPAGTSPLALYRTLNDGTGWQISELIFDTEKYGRSTMTFDENGERFTAHISSYGAFDPPCEYTAEFTEKLEYTLVLDWHVTLSYTFDDGLFTLQAREYGDWTAVSRKPDTSMPIKMDTFAGSELQRFCVSGTLRPVLP